MALGALSPTPPRRWVAAPAVAWPSPALLTATPFRDVGGRWQRQPKSSVPQGVSGEPHTGQICKWDGVLVHSAALTPGGTMFRASASLEPMWSDERPQQNHSTAGRWAGPSQEGVAQAPSSLTTRLVVSEVRSNSVLPQQQSLGSCLGPICPLEVTSGPTPHSCCEDSVRDPCKALGSVQRSLSTNRTAAGRDGRRTGAFLLERGLCHADRSGGTHAHS